MDKFVRNKVSIIVPTFNHEMYIKQCLESILYQSYQNWEALIIDDGSNDNTANIIKYFLEKDYRFKYFYQQNKGILRLNENYNKALSNSNGEFVAILEGDDFWPKNKLEKQIPHFSNKKVVLTYGNGKYFLNNKKYELPAFKIKYSKKIINNINNDHFLKKFIFNTSFCMMPACTIMFRKNALIKCDGFYQPKNCSWLDRSTILNLSTFGEFKFIPENLGIWRRHSLQVTQNLKSKMNTIDFIYNDDDCPVLLKEKLDLYKDDFHIFTKLLILFRTRKYKKMFLQILILLFTKPYKLIKIFSYMYL